MTREQELRLDERCPGGLPSTNFVGGLFDMLDVAKPKTALEIGCARGVSTEAFLLRCGHVVAVDRWQDMWAPMYDEFMRRVGHYPNLMVVKGDSRVVVPTLFQPFDLVYIDANHEYDDVKTDIRVAKLLAHRWLAGHDYHEQSDVARAVNEIGIKPRIFSDTSWLIDLTSQPAAES